MAGQDIAYGKIFRDVYSEHGRTYVSTSLIYAQGDRNGGALQPVPCMNGHLVRHARAQGNVLRRRQSGSRLMKAPRCRLQSLVGSERGQSVAAQWVAASM